MNRIQKLADSLSDETRDRSWRELREALMQVEDEAAHRAVRAIDSMGVALDAAATYTTGTGPWMVKRGQAEHFSQMALMEIGRMDG